MKLVLGGRKPEPRTSYNSVFFHTKPRPKTTNPQHQNLGDGFVRDFNHKPVAQFRVWVIFDFGPAANRNKLGVKPLLLETLPKVVVLTFCFRSGFWPKLNNHENQSFVC
jgi:hypothetical protein